MGGGNKHTTRQSWARLNYLALRKRQHDNEIEPQGDQKKFENIFSVSRWSGHNKCSNIATTNKFVA